MLVVVPYPCAVGGEPYWVCLSSRRLRPGQQIPEIIVDACDTEVRLTLEGTAQVVDAMRLIGEELDDGKDEVVGFVERVEDLVLRDRDGRRVRQAPLYLDEAQPARAGDAALDVVAELLVLAVCRLESEATLDFHDDGARTRGGGLSINRRAWGRDGPACEGGKEAHRYHQQAPKDHGWQRRELALELQLFQALLKTGLQTVGSLARLVGVETGIGLAGLLLKLEFLGAVIPVADLLGQPIFHRRLGLGRQLQPAPANFQ